MHSHRDVEGQEQRKSRKNLFKMLIVFILLLSASLLIIVIVSKHDRIDPEPDIIPASTIPDILPPPSSSTLTAPKTSKWSQIEPIANILGENTVTLVIIMVMLMALLGALVWWPRAVVLLGKFGFVVCMAFVEVLGLLVGVVELPFKALAATNRQV